MANNPENERELLFLRRPTNKQELELLIFIVDSLWIISLIATSPSTHGWMLTGHCTISLQTLVLPFG